MITGSTRNRRRQDRPRHHPSDKITALQSENVPKPGIDRLLIEAALDPDLCHRLAESPEVEFQRYDLSDEEQDILRRPDHRLLALLGAALTRRPESSARRPMDSAPQAAIQAHSLPDISLALTLVPCAQYENGQLKGLSYAAWVSPLLDGVDPATLPPPPGAALPGQPLSPLYAVISVAALQLQDSAGNPVVGLTASLRQSTNISAPPPPEAAGNPRIPPFGSDLQPEQVQSAITAVRQASGPQRYERIIDLIHALRSGDVV